ncbi:GNAT family N-acetyltransferase [Pedobacter rhodius]|uniref:GNAT family N-acetyltransferase n=1 Tax=Pedobacter rhodius TaxID=3004098 RepID=A0ABT4KVH5_9SPHI|nr:GNAT family N-acetyltransferase [Pedobacter sp. SJ11]MCZ4222923.1 GNAT family N-acetyltransferase [Pedobacter sp. SJ11]
MIKATYKDRVLVTNLLAASFKENQSIAYTIKQDGKAVKRIAALMAYAFDSCFKFGEVLLSDDRKACALVMYPHLKKGSLSTLWLDIKLIFKAVGIGGIFKVIKREGKIKEIQPKGEMAYLWFIGVKPALQHAGIGSKLLQEIIEWTAKKQLPLYLETSTPANLPWYKKFGFEIYGQLDLGYRLYFLSRK